MDTHYQLKQTKPYSPWHKAAEREIQELKKGSGCKMIATSELRCLWDNCLELEAYIHSHCTNSVYHLDGKVPVRYMSGETADISQFYKVAQYDWIMSCQDTFDYPYKQLYLGKYFGPAIDVGLAMTTKILQHDGEVV